MAHTYTLTTLKQAIVRWLEDDSDELAESLDNIIKLAESQLLKDLPFSIFDEVTGVVLTGNTATKPAGLVSIIDVFCCDGLPDGVDPPPIVSCDAQATSFYALAALGPSQSFEVAVSMLPQAVQGPVEVVPMLFTQIPENTQANAKAYILPILALTNNCVQRVEPQ